MVVGVDAVRRMVWIVSQTGSRGRGSYWAAGWLVIVMTLMSTPIMSVAVLRDINGYPSLLSFVFMICPIRCCFLSLCSQADSFVSFVQLLLRSPLMMAGTIYPCSIIIDEFFFFRSPLHVTHRAARVETLFVH